MKKYQVMVSNIGTVCDTDERGEALDSYIEYMRASRDGYGKTGGESVVLFNNGEIEREYPHPDDRKEV